MKQKHFPRWVPAAVTVGVIAFLLAANLLAQTLIAHRSGSFFQPDYPQEDLTGLLAQDTWTQEDYDYLFCQTGLGRPAAERLLSAGEAGRAVIRQVQRDFFAQVQVSCDPLLGWFTRAEHIVSDDGQRAWAPVLADLQAGDIILTLATHSLGWRHGHAGLVVEMEDGSLAMLECAVLGTNSQIMTTDHWRTYASYAVLRVRDLDAEGRKAASDYALEHLVGIPYHLSAGFIGPKAPDPDDFFFGLHCSYLVWYAWNAMGCDLDSDGGRLASSYDLLHSDLLEIVQLYGMDPREWVEAS